MSMSHCPVSPHPHSSSLSLSHTLSSIKTDVCRKPLPLSLSNKPIHLWVILASSSSSSSSAVTASGSVRHETILFSGMQVQLIINTERVRVVQKHRCTTCTLTDCISNTTNHTGYPAWKTKIVFNVTQSLPHFTEDRHNWKRLILVRYPREYRNNEELPVLVSSLQHHTTPHSGPYYAKLYATYPCYNTEVLTIYYTANNLSWILHRFGSNIQMSLGRRQMAQDYPKG